MQSVVESHAKAYLESDQISKKLFAKIFNDWNRSLFSQKAPS